MRGNPQNQAGQIFRALNRLGESRHEAKRQARADGLRGVQEIAQAVGVFSFATMHQYKSICTEFLTWCRDAHDMKDAAIIPPEMAAEWLSLKVASGSSRKTVSTYGAALNKMSAGLSTIYKRDFEYEKTLRPVRQEMQKFQPVKVKPRAYTRPEAMLQHLTGSHRLAAELQFYGGARVNEITRLKPEHMGNDGVIHLTNTKGGRRRDITVPPELHRRLSEIIAREGDFRFVYHQYRSALKSAAFESEQAYTGSHGLRWCFAQKMFAEIQETGGTYEHALKMVSEQLGHSRPEITLHYLQ
ncbi:MAG: tyrosine-type recombinase/integrase [Proteobacteria bacterium]|nr:tyrosine-type recombinase/integrase [Desulfocapsa sp.]MBU3944909.1 tyrosine-type recombinase/integrase [Pseudomonadota bacterium]MCG2744944.1 tyrosine-type recombinase/integrase [Desulfobacteraceae bacterium]MBU3982447.1 tyrosine-type recombinase/integrase [Pseudomonadota bacterium]MBU4027555.1 tyrosine-type recombinase/integrase [Pseudomonadota bacterium]